ncbi:MAG: hypothetical protein LBH12_07110 [Dysgonamonadaceae bacterium]|jgi:hypothetical protein|nr:hypothetical protein [Dysgonamonadaceae bacterium]
MKYFYKHAFLVLLGSFFFFVSCFEKEDFDFDKFTLENLNTTLHLPLFSDTITTETIGNGISFIDGQSYFIFDVADIEMPTVGEIFDVDNQWISVETPVELPDIPISFSGQYPTGESFYEYVMNLDLGSSAEELLPDSLVFSSLKMNMNNGNKFAPGKVTLNLEIPNLQNESGATFKKNIDMAGTGDIDLSGYSLKIDHGSSGTENQILFRYKLTFNGYRHTHGKFGFNMQLMDLHVEKAYGYLGHYTKHITESIVTNDLGTLDAEWDLKEVFLDLRVENKFALPFRVVIDELKSFPANGESPLVKTLVDSVDVAAQSVENLGKVETTSKMLGGRSLGEIASKLPQKLDLTIRMETNPGADSPVRNAVSLSIDDPIKVSARIMVPIKFKNTRLSIKDTLNIDMSTVEFSDMGIKLNVVNNFPAGVDLQCFLLEKGTRRHLGALFERAVSIPAAELKDVAGTTDEQEVGAPSHYSKFLRILPQAERNMQNSDEIIIDCTIKTEDDTKYVRITNQNNLQIKIGAKASVNLGVLED